MKIAAVLIYAWSTTIGYIVLLFWLSSIPNLEINNSPELDIAFKILYRMTMYSILYLLVYRSLLLTLKSTVDRLSKWRSKREKQEDTEFVLIIEALISFVSVLGSVLIATTEEFAQAVLLDGSRNAEFVDILVSSLSVLLTAIVVYTLPVLGELELGIKHRIDLYKSNKVKK